MSSIMVRVYFIPDYLTFTWLKEQEDKYHIYLEEYAEMVGEELIKIIEDAGVDLYDTLKELKDKGVYHMKSYSINNKKMGGIYNLLSLFEVYEYECGNEDYDNDIIINLNTPKERTLEKLRLLITLNHERKGKENGC